MTKNLAIMMVGFAMFSVPPSIENGQYAGAFLITLGAFFAGCYIKEKGAYPLERTYAKGEARKLHAHYTTRSDKQ